MKRVLHIVRSPGPDAVPAAAVAAADVLGYTYVPAPPPARAWLLWRDAEHEDHPRTVHCRVNESTEEDLFNRGGRSVAQLQVRREIQVGKGGDHVAEDEEAKKGEEHHGKKMMGQDIPTTSTERK